MGNDYTLTAAALMTCLVFAAGCKSKVYDSPPGYDLASPVTINLKKGLREISGISFCKGNEQSLLAIEDERGKFYKVSLPGGEITSCHFGEKGDYEDLACFNNKIFVLKSNGYLYSFSIPEKDSTVSNLAINDSLLPSGEYEGMATDKDTLYVLCKTCREFDAASNLLLYRFTITDSGNLSPAGNIQPQISIGKKSKNKPEKIHPSCLAKNPVDNNWYIISSANKLIMVFDDHFTMKNFYRLDPGLFGQPEGLTFKANGDMLISNEGGEGTANIRIFKYQE